MTEQEALKIVIANAACQLVGGCDLCPCYDETNDARLLQGKCQDEISIERVREAVTALRGYKPE